MNTKIAPIDLTQRPPRSFHVRLGGFVILSRMLDKGRATLLKKNGEYNYNSPTDQHLVKFLGFDPEALLKELGAGKGDGARENLASLAIGAYRVDDGVGELLSVVGGRQTLLFASVGDEGCLEEDARHLRA